VLTFVPGDKYLNIYYNSVADVNSSYIPVYGEFKTDSPIKIIHDQLIQVHKADIVELQLRIDRQAELGAITMGLMYDKNLIEVIETDYEVSLIDVENGIVRLAWASNHGIDVYEDDVIVNLTVRIIGDIKSGTQLFKLDNSTEFANAQAIPLTDLMLKVNGLTTEATAGDLFMINYPNPFVESTTISYSLPESGKVDLAVFNQMGQIVDVLVDEHQLVGAHTLEYQNMKLLPGAYNIRIILTGKQGQYIKTNTMIRIQ
jgi:hypothetical protein